MKSGAKYELFRLSTMLGVIITPRIGGQEVSAQLLLRLHGLPLQVTSLDDLIKVFNVKGISPLPTQLYFGGFDFENGNGVPLALFASPDACYRVWKGYRTILLPDGVKIQLARVHLRRSKQKFNNISLPSWPTKEEITKSVTARIQKGDILTGVRLPDMQGKDVLLPGGHVVVGARLIQLMSYPADVSDDEVCCIQFCGLLSCCSYNKCFQKQFTFTALQTRFGYTLQALPLLLLYSKPMKHLR